MRVVSFTSFEVNTIHIARTCQAFGFDFYADFYPPRLRKLSRCPSERKWPVIPCTEDMLHGFAKRGPVYALEEGGIPPWDVRWQPSGTLLVGRETGGIPTWAESLVTQKVWIPMDGMVQCLNAADAAVITMYEIQRYLRLHGQRIQDWLKTGEGPVPGSLAWNSQA